MSLDIPLDLNQQNQESEIDPAQEQEINPDLISALEAIERRILIPEDSIRYNQLREARKLEAFWSGYQRIFWNGESNDWATIEAYLVDEYPGVRLNEDTINIYRPHSETIISALAANIPKLNFTPSDAENGQDLIASKGYRKALDLIEKKNSMPMLMMKTFYIMTNQGVPFWYVYPEIDKKYGSVQFPRYSTQTEQIDQSNCATCSTSVDGAEPISPAGDISCQECGSIGQPVQSQSTQSYDVIDGYDEINKAKVCIEAYGLLNVKVATGIKSLKETPYLIFEREINVNTLREKYPWAKEKIKSSGDIHSFDRWARTPVEYAGGYSRDLATERFIWFRKDAYNELMNDSRGQMLREEFPEGCLVTKVNNEFIQVEEGSMDECWAMGVSPISLRAHFEPLGRSLASVQEYRTEMDDLVRQTMESSITETFADPAVLDFDEYNKVQATPGQVFPARARPGQNLDQAFAQLKPSTLTSEAPNLISRLDSDAQFVSGAFSPLYGGQSEGGSGTLGEYKLQGERALQRLATYWQIGVNLYKQAAPLAVAIFKKHLLEDEKIAVKSGNGGWVNLWIKQEELEGSIGEVESESADQMPMTWDQKQAKAFAILGMQLDPQNPMVSMMFNPANAENLAYFFGLPDLFVPGQDDRNKQLIEIAELLKSQPEENTDPNGQPIINPATGQPMPPTPSVPIEPLTDNEQIHVVEIIAWANSPSGLSAKVDNPPGYANVMAHLQAHQASIQAIQAQQMAQSQPPPTDQPPPEEEKQSSSEGPKSTSQHIHIHAKADKVA